MAFVYILKGDRYYIGSTTDLNRRLKEHRLGLTHTTRRIGSWKLVWKKEFPLLKDARLAEQKIKKWKSVKMIQHLLIGNINL